MSLERHWPDRPSLAIASSRICLRHYVVACSANLSSDPGRLSYKSESRSANREPAVSVRYSIVASGLNPLCRYPLTPLADALTALLLLFGIPRRLAHPGCAIRGNS